jgi:hypothetical protein
MRARLRLAPPRETCHPQLAESTTDEPRRWRGSEPIEYVERLRHHVGLTGFRELESALVRIVGLLPCLGSRLPVSTQSLGVSVRAAWERLCGISEASQIAQQLTSLHL